MAPAIAGEKKRVRKKEAPKTEPERRVFSMYVKLGGDLYAVVPVPKEKWKSWQKLVVKLVKPDGTYYTISVRHAPLSNGKRAYCSCPDSIFRRTVRETAGTGRSVHCKHADCLLAIMHRVFHVEEFVKETTPSP
jgi:hypothetical protein